MAKINNLQPGLTKKEGKKKQIVAFALSFPRSLADNSSPADRAEDHSCSGNRLQFQEANQDVPA